MTSIQEILFFSLFELWPKDKSLIHIKLIKPIRKDIRIWNERQLNQYLNDQQLDFDSSFHSVHVNQCLIQMKSDHQASDEISIEISGLKTSIAAFTKFVFAASKLDKIQRIDIIENLNLVNISARTFDGLMKLNYVSFLRNTNLNELNLETFAGIKQLEELIYVHNGRVINLFNVIGSTSSLILPHLIHLHIDYGHIQQFNDGLKITKNDLTGLSQVKYLQLTSCSIKSIHQDSFKSMLSTLNSLNLSNNTKLVNISKFIASFNSKSKIDRIDLSLITSLVNSVQLKDLLVTISKTSIKYLHLSGLKWKQIAEYHIPPMPNMFELNFDNSQIESIESTFEGFDQLKSLSLKQNYLKELSIFMLRSLSHLNYLDLSGYPKNRDDSFEIPEKFFIYATELLELNLNYKRLETLRRNQFLGLFKLQKLFIRGCSLELIEYLSFFPLKSIQMIDLSENPKLIEYIRTNDEIMIGLEAIKTLSISSNRLTTSDINLFQHINEHLQSIDLSNNLITTITPTTFKNFTQLKSINLNNNQIKSWSSYRVFNYNSHIQTLYISNNSISTITNEMLGDFRKLKNLTFSMNPLRCNCEWNGPLLLLDHKHHSNQHLDNHLEQLAHKQQQIVSTSFSNEALPKSLYEWLNTTTINFLSSHPLRSKNKYKCYANEPNESIPLKQFFANQCKQSVRKINLTLLSIISSSLLLLTVCMLIIAYVYHSTIGSIFSMVDDDFLHHYEYDAFVSYNVTDSDWVFKQLIPNLETTNESIQENQLNNNENESNQIKLCVYDRDFVAGRAISECVTESIRSSRKVILVISNNFASSPWCRFETDLAHNTLMDQNREGLILIKLEEICYDKLEKIAPQLHFLLKTRIYLQWNQFDKKEQQIFWKKLRHALGFTHSTSSTSSSIYQQLYKFKLSQTSKLKNKHSRRHSLVLLPSKNESTAANAKKESIQLQELKEIIVNKCLKENVANTCSASSSSSSSSTNATNNYTMNEMKADV
ncbi:toll-like receptor 13 [Leptotrombidium deliense]|uniref:Toll-like receptor 13 n=1 Tax=Leptotrombidium deliense TaxID=299467 RepID=A0A443SEH1_9ACAR|nr:toll-like receptor 13 [Leptotrombidium deliense]